MASSLFLQRIYNYSVTLHIYSTDFIGNTKSNWDYFVWLPNSEYCIDENALFDYEYYDERWDCQFRAAQMDIYVPVRKMEDSL